MHCLDPWVQHMAVDLRQYILEHLDLLQNTEHLKSTLDPWMSAHSFVFTSSQNPTNSVAARETSFVTQAQLSSTASIRIASQRCNQSQSIDPTMAPIQLLTTVSALDMPLYTHLSSHQPQDLRWDTLETASAQGQADIASLEHASQQHEITQQHHDHRIEAIASDMAQTDSRVASLEVTVAVQQDALQLHHSRMSTLAASATHTEAAIANIENDLATQHQLWQSQDQRTIDLQT